MTDQPAVVEPVTGADPNAAVAHATDDANKHTPPTPTPPAAEVAHSDEGIDGLREIVTSLATSVKTLTDLVTTEEDPDVSNADRLPLLLRGKRVHE